MMIQCIYLAKNTIFTWPFNKNYSKEKHNVVASDIFVKPKTKNFNLENLPLHYSRPTYFNIDNLRRFKSSSFNQKNPDSI